MGIVKLFSEYIPNQTELNKPYIIAEAGVNHEGSMEIARRLIEEAAEGGAHAIKFQAYRAETIASKDSPAYWDLSKEPTVSQFELFKKYDKFWKKEFEELKKKCDETGIEFISTPFDVESAEFLNDLMDVYKISSSDITNHPFIELICGFNKPILLSTGASDISEITEAVDIIHGHGNPLCLMHCILNYPTENKNANLGMILDLKKRFPSAVPGYSDHTLPGNMEALLTATMLGAEVLEKHFTHDKTLPGNDHYHAMDKKDLALFNHKLDELFAMLGSFEKKSLDTEELSRKNARRSLVAEVDIKKGEVVSIEMLTWKRPASGISPAETKKLLGCEAARDIDKDETLKWEMFNT